MELKIFEAVFHEGEYGERMPEWAVIEWTYTNPVNGARSGHTVQTFDYEEDAVEYAAKLNEQSN
jgi:hypothetical protein